MERPLYELDCDLLSPTAFHAKYSQLTAPTSLFKKLGQKEFNVVENEETQQNERSLTPVEDAVRGPVKSFNQLSHILRKRIQAKSYPVPALTANQQQALIGVVISELSGSWSEVKRLAPDPFLSYQQNEDVKRFLAIELINIAEELYFSAVHRAKELNERGVFSTYANNSRMKTQLALEANQSFDVRKIHKRLCLSFKQTLTRARDNRVSASNSDNTLYAPQLARLSCKRGSEIRRPTIATLVIPSRLTREQRDRKRRDSDIFQLQTQMPDISVRKVEETYGIYDYDIHRRPESVKDETVNLEDDDASNASENLRPVPGVKKRCRSLPNLLVGESLLEELGIRDGDELTRRDSVDNLGINLTCGGTRPTFDSGSVLGGMRGEEANYLSADLKKLVADGTFAQLPATSEQDQDLPPLFQALSYQSTKKKKVLPASVDVDHEEVSELASTVASSVAYDEDIDEKNETDFVPPVQPATVSTRLPDKSVVRTSDVRVSSRVNMSEVTVKTFPTSYNDLIGEIDAATVKWLDRNLYIGDEIREVYEEVIKTVGTDYLLFDQDPYVENHATGVNFSTTLHSAMVTGNKADRVINPSLHRDIPPPWGKHESVEEWKNSPMFGELGRQDILNMGQQGLNEFPGKVTKSYNSWLAWYRSTITTDDYFKYLTSQDNDYLSLTYHLYESDESDKENDGDKDQRPNAKERELKKAREEKIAEIRKLKEHFDTGYWNANSVLLGGLGKYPEIMDEELRINMQTVSVGESTDNEDSSLTPCSQLTNGKRAETCTPLSLQDRLERVWTLLCMPENLRLDMAIKYSSELYIQYLEEVLQQWETAVKLILDREALIIKLEDFERLASDPNRFFEKGGPGSASSRIKESKTRKQFHRKLDNVEVRVKKAVITISETFGDVVTFQGRPYLEKMSSDRTEMLYWLQQERRQTALEMAKKTVELKMMAPPSPVSSSRSPVNTVV